MRKIKGGNRKKERWIAVVLVTAVFVLMWVIRPWKLDAPKAVEIETPKARRVIDGVLVLQGRDNPPLAGVMIENMIEAQPLSGIADAVLVFEAVVEANITRFLAYFALPSPGPMAIGPPSPSGRGEGEGAIEIGPVRSARPYFLDFAAEFNTLYAHVGSSPAAYELLRKKGVEGVRDLDQWYNEQYFFSKAGRPKPHHLYTSTELLEKAYEATFRHSERSEESRVNTRDLTFVRDPSSSATPQDDGDFALWQFKNDASPDLRGDVNDIQVGYVAPYDVRWVYDKFENQYKRMQWKDDAHLDVNGKAIMTKNIAVAFMEMKVLDEIGRKEFKTLGEGKGLVFQDGRVVVGKWKKPSMQERLRFYDAQGSEVSFNAGTTWVEIVPTGYVVKY